MRINDMELGVRLVVVSWLVAAAGCGRSRPPVVEPPPLTTPLPVRHPVDPPVEPPAPDEETIRAGKATGLGGAGERPEVATEALVDAVGRGDVTLAALVDPAFGLYEARAIRIPPDTREYSSRLRCGAALDASLTRLAGELAAARDPGLPYELACDNAALVAPGSGVSPHALCTLETPALLPDYDLVFVPRAGGGLRLAGVRVELGDEDEVRDWVEAGFDAGVGAGTACR